MIRWNKRLLVTSVILVGLLIGASRMLLPGVSDYRADIEQLAEEILDRPVTIQQVESGWSGLSPYITFKGVEIEQRHYKGVVHLDSLDVVLGILPSLRAGELRPQTIILRMQQLELSRAADGRYIVNLGDLTESGDTSFGKEHLDWIRQQPNMHMDIGRFSFTDDMGEIPAIQLHDVDLDFMNQSEELIARLTTGNSELAEAISLMSAWIPGNCHRIITGPNFIQT